MGWPNVYRHDETKRDLEWDPILIQKNTSRTDLQILIEGDSIIRQIPLYGATSVSVGGLTINKMIKRQLNGPSIAYDPDLVVINIGTNDVERPPHNLKDQIIELFQLVRRNYPNRVVVLMAVRHRPKDIQWSLGVNTSLTSGRETINSTLKQCCEMFGGFIFKNPHKLETISDGTGVRRIREEAFHRDGLHLSRHGKERYAVAVSDIAYGYLRKTIKYMSSRPCTVLELPDFPISIERRMNTILFKGRESLLSNFAPTPVDVLGKRFPTGEHAYQYIKAIHHGKHVLAQQILEIEDPKYVKITTDQVITWPDESWLNVRLGVMELIQVERVLQHQHLVSFLTANRAFLLVENTSNEFWARGAQQHGENHLGRILMGIGYVLAIQRDDLLDSKIHLLQHQIMQSLYLQDNKL